MQDPRWPTSDLLALRDGQPVDSAVDSGLSDTDRAARQAEIDMLNSLRAQLNDLPDVPVDDELWMSKRRLGGRSSWLRFPMATAASVFFATAVGIYLLAGQLNPQAPAGVIAVETTPTFHQVDDNGLQLARLMTQSKGLERRLQASNSILAVADGGDPQRRQAAPVERAMLFRLADVDAQIAALYEQQEMDSERRLQLWQQRVDVLQNMVAVRAGQTPQILQDSRSM